METLRETIRRTLKHYNSRQSYFGRDRVPERNLDALSSMLETQIQRNLQDVFGNVEEHANEPDTRNDLETLERTYNVIKVLVKELAPDESVTVNEEDIFFARDDYLIIENEGEVTHLSVSDVMPEDAEEKAEPWLETNLPATNA